MTPRPWPTMLLPQPDRMLERTRTALRHVLTRGMVGTTRLHRWRQGRPASIPSSPSLTIVGLPESASGIGAAARGMQRALADRSPKTVSLSELSRTPRVPDLAIDTVAPRSRLACMTDIAIHVYNPDIFFAAVRRFGTRFLTAARMNVALSIWETDTLPPLWIEILSLYDVVATHSRFAARSFERAIHRPVAVIPHCLPEQPIRVRKAPEGHFELLCLFDHMSDPARKNPLGNIVAFRNAWRRLPPGLSARLHVKCHAGTPRLLLDTLREAAEDAPVTFIAETLDETGMTNLWQECDCLLSLHRSEGFGLPVAEALSRSIPVITTRQGGVLDFLDDSGGFLVSGAAATGDGSKQYPEHSGWVEPDLDDAARCIVELLTDYRGAARRAAKGRARVLDQLSVGQVVRCFDEAIRQSHHKLPQGRHECRHDTRC